MMRRFPIHLLIALALFLIACGRSTTQSVAPTSTISNSGGQYEKGALRVFICCPGGPEDLKIRDRINKQFEADHPGVRIKQEILPAGTNYFEKLQTMIASGSPPDVFDM